LADFSEKYLKFKLAYQACWISHQTEFPPRPSWLSDADHSRVLLGGNVHGWMRGRHDCRDLRLFNDLTQVKKGMPPVSLLFVGNQVDETLKACSVLHERPADRLHARLYPRIMRLIDAIFPVGWYRAQGPYLPSISGHFLSVREEFGALGAILQRADQLRRETPVVLFQHLAELIHVPEYEAPVPKSLEMSELPDYSCMLHNTIQVPTVDLSLLLSASDLLMKETTLPGGRIPAVPTGIAEPFKARVVNGGPEGTYFRAKWIQKATHSHIRRLPQFRLLGATLTTKILDQLPQLGPDEFYVSGDYTAATDNIDPVFSEGAAHHISRNGLFAPEWEDLYLQTLTRHSVLPRESLRGFK